LVQSQTAVQEGDAAADRFFLGAWGTFPRLPMPLELPEAPADLKAAKRALAQSRTDHQAARSAYLDATGRADAVRHRLYQAALTLVFLKTGVKIKPADYGLKTATPAAAESARDRAEAELRQLR